MAPPIANNTWERTVAGLAKLVERITPWLLDLGNWIFGALIAFNLLVLSALLTIGPVDKAWAGSKPKRGPTEARASRPSFLLRATVSYHRAHLHRRDRSVVAHGLVDWR